MSAALNHQRFPFENEAFLPALQQHKQPLGSMLPAEKGKYLHQQHANSPRRRPSS